MQGIDILASYARNGREAVNMIQISAGLAITEDRKYIKDEDIEWVDSLKSANTENGTKVNPDSSDWAC